MPERKSRGFRPPYSCVEQVHDSSKPAIGVDPSLDSRGCEEAYQLWRLEVFGLVHIEVAIGDELLDLRIKILKVLDLVGFDDSFFYKLKNIFGVHS